MAKFDIPRFRYLFQDSSGDIYFCTNQPQNLGEGFYNGGSYYYIPGTTSQKCKTTLIDLDKDDYDFEDGILRRIEK